MPRGRGDAGWTLVELVVVMVLLGVVGAVAFKALAGVLGSANQAMSHATAQHLADQVADQFGQELRSARAHDRLTDAASDPDALRQMVLVNPATRGTLDLSDITLARPDAVTFEADVVPEAAGIAAAPECVTYRVVTAGGKWQLVRIVSRYVAGCPPIPPPAAGAPGRTDLTPLVAGAAPAIFSYTLMHNTRPNQNPLDVTQCRTSSQSSVVGTDRDWIVAVSLDLHVLVNRGDGSGSEARATSIGLRTRQTVDYVHALGCGT